jgi:SAM-dependent methyltransferase
MTRPRLYGELARYWPLISPHEEYEDGADNLRAALGAGGAAGGRTLLDLGTGGGHHLHALLDDFRATAVDLSEGMQAVSRALHPEVEHVRGDLREVRLGRTFDAVLLHDSVSYMLTEDDLSAAFATAAAHLEPGGVFVVAPDWFSETFPDRTSTFETRERNGTEVTYFDYTWDPDPTDHLIRVDMTFLIREGERVRMEEDRHVMGVFPRATWLERLAGAGFAVEEREHVASDHGYVHCLLVCRKLS